MARCARAAALRSHFATCVRTRAHARGRTPHAASRRGALAATLLRASGARGGTAAALGRTRAVRRARGALARVLGDELLGVRARLVIGPLVLRRLHEVRRGPVELSADAVVERELAAAHGVDDD